MRKKSVSEISVNFLMTCSTGLVYIWAVSFTQSLLLIPFIVLAIVGFKRFSKMDAVRNFMIERDSDNN